MLNIGRRDAVPDPKNPAKPALGPAPYGNASNNPSLPTPGTTRSLTPTPTPGLRDNAPPLNPARDAGPGTTAAPSPAMSTESATAPAAAPASKLFVGVNI